VCAAKNSGVTRFFVASHVTAFAPFSQNWKVERCSLSGHAHRASRAVEAIGLIRAQQHDRREHGIHLLAGLS
jgi:hypothetical protein